MGRLRAGTTELLVATDVAARGLDVEQLTHVINFNVPVAPEAYVHRIGRVGRAGREGSAITLAEPREQRMLKAIERLTGQRITLEKLPTVTDLRAKRLELTRTALQASLEPFVAHRQEIRALYESYPKLTKRSRDNALAYIDQFYEVLADPKRVDRAFRSSCSE